MTTYNPERLGAIGTQRTKHLKAARKLQPEIVEQIKAGGAAGVDLAELVRLSGYGEERVRQLRDGLDRTGKKPAAE